MIPHSADVPESVLAAVARAHADCRPQEVCGFWVRDASSTTDEFRRVPNLAPEPGGFWCDGRSVEQILSDIARHRQTVVAFLHTHEWSAEPSDADCRAASTSGFPWLILRQDQAAWRVIEVTPAGGRLGEGVDSRWRSTLG